MQSEEKNLISEMNVLADCLVGHDRLWADLLRQHASEAKALFDRNTSLFAKFDFVKSHNYATAGIGSLNDGVVPECCVAHRQKLYRTINELLRRYWKQLGRESHNYSDFKLIPDGTAVQLVPGKTIFQNGVYSTEVSCEQEQPGSPWIVLRCEGPDITNMPNYTIRRDDMFRSARHEALRTID